MHVEAQLNVTWTRAGGLALAAEKIVKVCRTYSGDDFEVLVPKAAKSAATMIAMGARRILMEPTAELGPIDPQVPRKIGDQLTLMPAHAIITSYEQHIREAVALGPDGRVEPLLRMLETYDASEIEFLRKLRDL